MLLRRRVSVLALVLVWSTLLAAQTFIKIRVEHANARAEPNSQAEIVAVLNRDQTFAVTSDVPYWYGIRLQNGDTAYVAKSLCSVMPEEGENESGNLTGQPLTDIYSLPPAGNTLTLPNCTTTTISADWTVCPQEGSGGMNRLANLQKNRVALPCAYTVTTFDEMLGLKNLPRGVRSLSTGDQRRVYLEDRESRPMVFEGYLAMVKSGGEESPNCKSSERTDLHMELVSSDAGDPKDSRNKVVVTEVTPWFGEARQSWTLDALSQFASYRSGYSGTMLRVPGKARIYGWLFFDNWHSGDGSVGTWRGTAWEIHPITRIEVWQNGTWRVVE